MFIIQNINNVSLANMLLLRYKIRIHNTKVKVYTQWNGTYKVTCTVQSFEILVLKVSKVLKGPYCSRGIKVANFLTRKIY